MNKREILHNAAIVLLVLVMLSGSLLVMLWRSYPENRLLYVLSNSLCASSLVLLGGFLLLFSNAVQDRFIKESFLKKFMNEKEETGNIFKFRAHAFGVVFIVFGLIVIFILLLNSSYKFP